MGSILPSSVLLMFSILPAVNYICRTARSYLKTVLVIELVGRCSPEHYGVNPHHVEGWVIVMFTSINLLNYFTYEIKKLLTGIWLYNYGMTTNYFSKQFTTNDIGNHDICKCFQGKD